MYYISIKKWETIFYVKYLIFKTKYYIYCIYTYIYIQLYIHIIFICIIYNVYIYCINIYYRDGDENSTSAIFPKFCVKRQGTRVFSHLKLILAESAWNQWGQDGRDHHFEALMRVSSKSLNVPKRTLSGLVHGNSISILSEYLYMYIYIYIYIYICMWMYILSGNHAMKPSMATSGKGTVPCWTVSLCPLLDCHFCGHDEHLTPRFLLRVNDIYVNVYVELCILRPF